MKYKQLIFSTSKKSLTLDVGSELLSFYQLHEKLKGRFGWLLKYGLAITFFPLLGGIRYYFSGYIAMDYANDKTLNRKRRLALFYFYIVCIFY